MNQSSTLSLSSSFLATPSPAGSIWTPTTRSVGKMWTPMPRRGARRCGQCEKKPQAVFCQQCQEVFCWTCAAAIHQRGKMAYHTAVDLLTESESYAPVGTNFKSLLQRGNRERPSSPEGGIAVRGGMEVWLEPDRMAHKAHTFRSSLSAPGRDRSASPGQGCSKDNLQSFMCRSPQAVPSPQSIPGAISRSSFLTRQIEPPCPQVPIKWCSPRVGYLERANDSKLDGDGTDRQAMFCSLHPGVEVAFCCLSCKGRFLCAFCAAACDRERHCLFSFNEAMRQLPEKLLDLEKMMEQGVCDSASTAGCARSLLRYLEDMASRCRHKVQSCFDVLRAGLDADEHALNMEVDCCSREVSQLLRMRHPVDALGETVRGLLLEQQRVAPEDLVANLNLHARLKRALAMDEPRPEFRTHRLGADLKHQVHCGFASRLSRIDFLARGLMQDSAAEIEAAEPVNTLNQSPVHPMPMISSHLLSFPSQPEPKMAERLMDHSQGGGRSLDARPSSSSPARSSTSFFFLTGMEDEEPRMVERTSDGPVAIEKDFSGTPMRRPVQKNTDSPMLHQAGSELESGEYKELLRQAQEALALRSNVRSSLIDSDLLEAKLSYLKAQMLHEDNWSMAPEKDKVRGALMDAGSHGLNTHVTSMNVVRAESQHPESVIAHKEVSMQRLPPISTDSQGSRSQSASPRLENSIKSYMELAHPTAQENSMQKYLDAQSRMVQDQDGTSARTIHTPSLAKTSIGSAGLPNHPNSTPSLVQSQVGVDYGEIITGASNQAKQDFRKEGQFAVPPRSSPRLSNGRESITGTHHPEKDSFEFNKGGSYCTAEAISSASTHLPTHVSPGLSTLGADTVGASHLEDAKAAKGTGESTSGAVEYVTVARAVGNDGYTHVLAKVPQRSSDSKPNVTGITQSVKTNTSESKDEFTKGRREHVGQAIGNDSHMHLNTSPQLSDWRSSGTGTSVPARMGTAKDIRELTNSRVEHAAQVIGNESQTQFPADTSPGNAVWKANLASTSHLAEQKAAEDNGERTTGHMEHVGQVAGNESYTRFPVNTSPRLSDWRTSSVRTSQPVDAISVESNGERTRALVDHVAKTDGNAIHSHCPAITPPRMLDSRANITGSCQPAERTTTDDHVNCSKAGSSHVHNERYNPSGGATLIESQVGEYKGGIRENGLCQVPHVVSNGAHASVPANTSPRLSGWKDNASGISHPLEPDNGANATVPANTSPRLSGWKDNASGISHPLEPKAAAGKAEVTKGGMGGMAEAASNDSDTGFPAKQFPRLPEGMASTTGTSQHANAHTSAHKGAITSGGLGHMAQEVSSESSAHVPAHVATRLPASSQHSQVSTGESGNDRSGHVAQPSKHEAGSLKDEGRLAGAGGDRKERCESQESMECFETPAFQIKSSKQMDACERALKASKTSGQPDGEDAQDRSPPPTPPPELEDEQPFEYQTSTGSRKGRIIEDNDMPLTPSKSGGLSRFVPGMGRKKENKETKEAKSKKEKSSRRPGG